ncbi:MAG: fluoride efflux transporter CrcB [Rhodospirillaceae bacterium]
MKMLIAVAMGGAMGAVGRYLVMSGVGHWLGHGFPWGTIAVNLIGSFILGGLIEYSALVATISQEARGFLVVGALGAFTTFSAFSLDAYTLMDRGQMAAAAGYALGSVVLCLFGFWAGLAIIRQVAA